MSTVLITGGHKGVGLEAVRRIASQGNNDLLLAGRNMAEVKAVIDELATNYGVKIKGVNLDVSSMASVRSAAASTRDMVDRGEIAPLQVLLLNAGAQFLGPIRYSVDGYELTFATNCLGHFLLLNLLLDKVQEGGRVVFTASGTHDPDTMDGKMVGKAVEPDANALANDGRKGKPLPGGTRYSTSKLCTMMYAYELDRRLRARRSSVQSIAFDPGLMVETGLVRSAPPVAQRLMRTSVMKTLFRMIGITMGSTPFSGDVLAKLAIDPAFAQASGKYIQSHNGRLIEARSSTMSYDERRARKLWSDSETLAGLRP